jgi:hypothetical protein
VGCGCVIVGLEFEVDVGDARFLVSIGLAKAELAPTYYHLR